jgi:hypothetical protein
VPVVRGIIFFGVPHRGLETGDIQQMVSNTNPRQELLAAISSGSEELKGQVEQFRHIVKENKIQIISFYERKQTRGLSLVRYSPAFKRNPRF